MASEVYQVTIYFSGQVQGVGFRWTTEGIAAGFDVNGRVMNLEDGRVLLEAEGEEDEVQRFLEALRVRMKNNIQKEELSESRGESRFSSFYIDR